MLQIWQMWTDPSPWTKTAFVYEEPGRCGLLQRGDFQDGVVCCVPGPCVLCLATMEFCSKAIQVTQKRGAKSFLQRLVSTWDGGQIRLPESP